MRAIFLACLLAVSFSTQGLTAQLSAADIRMLLSVVGFNPGTVRQLGEKGLHQLVLVKVTGKHGHFTVHIVEREVRPVVVK